LHPASARVQPLPAVDIVRCDSTAIFSSEPAAFVPLAAGGAGAEAGGRGAGRSLRWLCAVCGRRLAREQDIAGFVVDDCVLRALATLVVVVLVLELASQPAAGAEQRDGADDGAEQDH
jgi:hypothetical protein